MLHAKPFCTRPRREAPMPPLEGEVAERSEVGGVVRQQSVQENPSVSPFGLPAPLSGAPRALRAAGRLLVDPYRAFLNSLDVTKGVNPE